MKPIPCTVLKGGTIIDGTGSPPFLGEVGIADGWIVSVFAAQIDNPLGKADTGFEVIDCTGSVIVPGFIDAHSHSDLQILRNCTEKLLQGVTTEVVGNCGVSAYPLPEDPQQLRDFTNGIFCGDNEWGWVSASDYLDTTGISRVAIAVSLVGH